MMSYEHDLLKQAGITASRIDDSQTAIFKVKVKVQAQ
jgi:hypothetical protein